MPQGQFDRGPGSAWRKAMDRLKKTKGNGRLGQAAIDPPSSPVREAPAVTRPKAPPGRSLVAYWRLEWTRNP